MAWQALLRTVLLGTLLLLGQRCSEGAVTETTSSNRPPFSFSCGSQGSGTFSYCSTENKKYVQVQSVEIYRDYSNEVGKCLDAEKYSISELLISWFNNDCKIPSTDRDDENKKMPIDWLKSSMTKYCGIQNADVTRIVVNYECVRNLGDVTNKLPEVRRDNDTLTISTRPAVVIVPVLSSTTASTTKSTTSTASTSITPAVRTPPVRPPGDISSSSTAGTIDENAATPSSGSSDISTGAWIAIGFALLIFLLIMIGLLFVFCCWLPSRREKRKQGVPAEVGGPRMSTLYLVPGTYKSNLGGGSGDDLSAMAYGGSAVENEYALSPSDAGGRRSMDRSVGTAVAVNESDIDATVDKVQQRSSRSSGPLSITYGNFGGVGSVDGNSVMGGYSQAYVGAGAGGGSRRSSADPDASGAGGNGFYDRRLSDRRLILARHPSETSIPSVLGGSMLQAESRKLSRTSYAELPSDRRVSSSSSGEARKVSLALGTADERRLSSESGLDTASTPVGRRPTTYGGPGMPHIDERFEAAAAAAQTAAGSAAGGDLANFSGDVAYYGGRGTRGSASEDVFYGGGSSGTSGRALSLDATGNLRTPVDDGRTGKAGRLSWGGETETEVNYSFWPPEWQRWLQNRPSNI